MPGKFREIVENRVFFAYICVFIAKSSNFSSFICFPLNNITGRISNVDGNFGNSKRGQWRILFCRERYKFLQREVIITVISLCTDFWMTSMILFYIVRFTICPISSYPIYIVTYILQYIMGTYWVTASWTDSKRL